MRSVGGCRPGVREGGAYTARAERFGGENKQRWLDLVAKYGVPDIPALAEKYGMRMI